MPAYRSLLMIALCAAVLAAALGAAPSCSLLTGTSQCASDADCVNKGAAFVGTTCTAGLCLGKPADAGECARNAECVAKYAEHYFCRDRTCIPLYSAECRNVVGNDQSDDAIIFGSVLDLKDAGDGGGGVDVNLAIELAFDEFAQAFDGGAPRILGGSSRPLVLVECDEALATSAATTAAKHLVSTVRVPAIIGASTTASTLALARVAAIPSVLILTPSATGDLTSVQGDGGLVWRTVASDALEGRVMAFERSEIVTELVDGGQVKPVRVALAVWDENGYGAGLAAGIESVGFDVASVDQTRVDYSPDAGPSDLVQQVATLKPHIVLMASGSEGVSIINALEAAAASADAGAFIPPKYVLSSAMGSANLFKATDTARARIRGTLPGKPDSARGLAFRDRFLKRFHHYPGTGASNAYDAAYVLAYAVVAAGDKPLTGITGADLRDAFRKRLDDETLDGGPDDLDLTDAFARLNAGLNIDLNGVSGPLDFDVNGNVETDVEIWCLAVDSGAVVLQSANQKYAANTGNGGPLVGTFSCPP
jgi:branched-chain amino acid transport system substrate-binding protein